MSYIVVLCVSSYFWITGARKNIQVSCREADPPSESVCRLHPNTTMPELTQPPPTEEGGVDPEEFGLGEASTIPSGDGNFGPFNSFS